MALPEDLLPGSYDGEAFLIKDSTTTGGKKAVIKKFPNSRKQSIENLGGIPKSFQLTAILTGDNYIQRRNSLILRLDRETFGILIHPFYGRIENVLPTSYQVLEDTSQLGNGRISITFEVNDSPGTPETTGVNLNSVLTSNSSLIGGLTDSYTNTFNVSGRFPSNFTNAVNKINDVVTSFRDNTSFLSVAADQIDSFTLQLGELSNNVTQLVSDPVRFATSVNNIFESINGLYTTPEATFQVLRRLFDFGDDDITITKNTASRIEKIGNNAVMNQFIQTQALGYAYVNVSQLDFTTVGELTEFSEELETQYQKIVNNLGVNLTDPDVGISKEAKSLLTDMRVLVQTFLDNKRLTTQQIVDVYTVALPSRVIAYQYYGSSDQGDTIAELNSSLINSSNLEGNIKVLSS